MANNETVDEARATLREIIAAHGPGILQEAVTEHWKEQQDEKMTRLWNEYADGEIEYWNAYQAQRKQAS